LFPSIEKKKSGWEKIDRAVDRVAQRFGHSAIHRGSLTPPEDLSMD
jgi:hypothetical protein